MKIQDASKDITCWENFVPSFMTNSKRKHSKRQKKGKRNKRGKKTTQMDEITTLSRQKLPSSHKQIKFNTKTINLKHKHPNPYILKTP